MKRKDPVITRRNDLIKAFITRRDMSLVDEIPECFGGLPQGNESAWAKGCKECPLYLYSNACSNATHVCQEIYWNDKKYKLVTTETICEWCQGAGYLALIAGNDGTRKCHKCDGKAKNIKHTMEEQ